MKKILITIAIISALAFNSCKTTNEAIPEMPANTTNSIKVPIGFTWQNSRNLNFTISLTDVRFPKSIYMISIYNGDPSNGGSLLIKGSATTQSEFRGRVYTSNQTTQIHIIKTAPDNSKTVKKVSIENDDIITSIGL